MHQYVIIPLILNEKYANTKTNKMNQNLIEKMLVFALVEAENLSVNITISIIDMGGHLIALRRTEIAVFLLLKQARKKL